MSEKSYFLTESSFLFILIIATFAQLLLTKGLKKSKKSKNKYLL